jgi:hypothetical protein
VCYVKELLYGQVVIYCTLLRNTSRFWLCKKEKKEEQQCFFHGYAMFVLSTQVHAHMSMDVKVDFMPMLISGPWVCCQHIC